MEFHSLESNHHPLDESDSFHADSSLNPHLLSGDQLDHSVSDIPFLDSHPFEHSDPYSISFIDTDSQFLHGFQPLDPASPSVDEWQSFPSFDNDHTDVNSHFQLGSHHQRLGSADITPSSPSNIQENSEVRFRGPDHQEHTGTIMIVHPDNTYEIQASNASYDHVAYHDILKYGSK
jgi:hypothetical protein